MSLKTKVLIIDDEPDVADLIKNFLGTGKYGFKVCHTGEAALDRIADNSSSFDIVLLDLNLPDMSGLKVLEALSIKRPRACVIIITGHASLESATEAMRYGAHDYLTKPFIRQELVKTVRNAVARNDAVCAREEAEAALAASEERFRYLVENALTGILIIQNHRVVYHNPMQQLLFGPITAVFEKGDFQCIHSDDIENLNESYRCITSGKGSVADVDFRFYDTSGQHGGREIKWVLCRASRIIYQKDEAILVNLMDITRLKELERLVAIKHKMHSLGHVAAGIAHEIRNPLSTINAYLFALEGIIEDHIADPERRNKGKQITQQIQKASKNIETVIRRVMDFARPGSPKMAFVDINTAMKEAVKLSIATLSKNNIQIDQSLAADLPHCYADIQLIEQVFLNLIHNGIGALANTDGERVISVVSYAKDGKVCVQVSDSGPGISPDIREKIFLPFYTTKSDGAGIGLNIVSRIIEDHHGRIDVADSRWGGAQFTVELPIDRRAQR
jgi:PAS domain S-box-containing protein